MLSSGSRVFIRNFAYTSKRNPITTNYRPPTRSTWDHVYGLSSVLAALRSKKRSVMGTLYILESDEKKTTQKKDSRLMDEILQLSKESKIYVVSADKGRLNNLTDNKTHQVTKKKNALL